MSVLLWWLPATLVVAGAWWRWRPGRAGGRARDLRRLERILRGYR